MPENNPAPAPLRQPVSRVRWASPIVVCEQAELPPKEATQGTTPKPCLKEACRAYRQPKYATPRDPERDWSSTQWHNYRVRQAERLLYTSSRCQLEEYQMNRSRWQKMKDNLLQFYQKKVKKQPSRPRTTYRDARSKYPHSYLEEYQI